MPGSLVRATDPTTIVWPDYAGNMMFQTLGNIAAHPAAGLLFVDFERGATLQVTGTARILWDGEGPTRLAGAERGVQLSIVRAIEIEGNVPRGWTRPEPSPHNPPVGADR